MTFSTIADAKVSLTTYHEGEGFRIVLGNQSAILTTDQAQRLSEYLVTENPNGHRE